MKKSIFILALAAFACGTVSAQNAPISAQPVIANAPVTAGPQMTFEAVEINYGKIAKGSERKRVFKFKNTGTSELNITNAAGSCGCTVPTWPHEAIAVGAEGSIEVNYDTNRIGAFTKYVTLTTNAPGQESFRLTIMGEVQQEPEAVPAQDQGVLSTPAGH